MLGGSATAIHTVQRRLMTVFSADEKGYSRLMGEDEPVEELAEGSGICISGTVYDSIKKGCPWVMSLLMNIRF